MKSATGFDTTDPPAPTAALSRRAYTNAVNPYAATAGATRWRFVETALAPVVSGAGTGSTIVAFTDGATLTDTAPTAPGRVDPRDETVPLEPVAAADPAIGREARAPGARTGPAVEDEPDDELDPFASAQATAGNAAIPTPTPNAIAKNPTRPTQRAPPATPRR